MIRARVLSLLAMAAMASCSFYSFPSGDLRVHLSDPGQGNEVKARVDEFARQKGLKVSRNAAADAATPPEARADLSKSTYYVSGSRTGGGVLLSYFDASSSCKAVRLYDESGEWTEPSKAALAQLRALLAGVEGVRVEAANVPEDWERTTRGLNEVCEPEKSATEQGVAQ